MPILYKLNQQRSKENLNLILASSSRYRKSLLLRLTKDFTVQSPDIDETPLAGESGAELVKRLSRQKAERVGGSLNDALVIGSDQCAVLGDAILGKPGNFENALNQLMQCAGRQVVFHTGLCLLDTRDGTHQYIDVPTTVEYDAFSEEQASNYLKEDQPWDCCGSIRSESKGVVLCKHIISSDPGTLLGLPIIALAKMLTQAGYKLL